VSLFVLNSGKKVWFKKFRHLFYVLVIILLSCDTEAMLSTKKNIIMDLLGLIYRVPPPKKN